MNAWVFGVAFWSGYWIQYMQEGSPSLPLPSFFLPWVIQRNYCPIILLRERKRESFQAHLSWWDMFPSGAYTCICFNSQNKIKGSGETSVRNIPLKLIMVNVIWSTYTFWRIVESLTSWNLSYAIVSNLIENPKRMLVGKIAAIYSFVRLFVLFFLALLYLL